MTGEERHLDLPRGFHDVNPDRMAIYRRLQEQWFRLCGLAGYQTVEVPPVGFAATFTAGHHAAGERTYRFPDRRGRDLALVSDSLPALLRLAHARRLSEQRLSYCCPVFRYERKPRRYFHHLGLMEVSSHPSTFAAQSRSTRRLADIVIDFLAPYCVAGFTITDSGLWYELLDQFLPPRESATYLNSLRGMPAEERPGRLRADGAPEAVVDVVQLLASGRAGTVAAGNGRRGQAAAPPSIAERIAGCYELADALRQRGVETRVDLNELHASEFHDGPSFVLRERGGQVLGDGGSYGRFGNAFLTSSSPVAAHAAVIGLERLTDLVAEIDPPDARSADVAVLTAPDTEAVDHADLLTGSLREAGISVWDVVVSRPIRQHLRTLAELAIPYSVFVGSRELSSDNYAVRDRTGTLHVVPHRDIAQWLTTKLATRS